MYILVWSPPGFRFVVSSGEKITEGIARTCVTECRAKSQGKNAQKDVSQHSHFPHYWTMHSLL